MRLTIKERIILKGILPENGGMAKMTLVRELLKKTAITSDDVQKTGMTDTSEDPNTEFGFNDSELALLIEAAEMADKSEKITMDNLSLIEKILTS